MSAGQEIQVEFLVEEISMKFFLEGLLPRILPKGYSLGINCFLRHFQGKQQLLKELPNKIKAYQSFQKLIYVVVLVDQDFSDCKDLKRKIAESLGQTTLPHLLIRIVCRELESWYLGDLSCVKQVYPGLNSTQHMNRAKFRNPDGLRGSQELSRLVKGFNKNKAAQGIGRCIRISENSSASFQQFVHGLEHFLPLPPTPSPAPALGSGR